MTTWTALAANTHHKDKRKMWFRKACLSKEFERIWKAWGKGNKSLYEPMSSNTVQWSSHLHPWKNDTAKVSKIKWLKASLTKKDVLTSVGPGNVASFLSSWGSRDLSSKSRTQVLPTSLHHESSCPVHSGQAGDQKTRDLMDQTPEKKCYTKHRTSSGLDQHRTAMMNIRGNDDSSGNLVNNHWPKPSSCSIW